MPLILGAQSAVSTGDVVTNSCRFDGSSTYLHKTPGSSGNLRKWTFSTWVKISLIGGSRVLIGAPSDGSNYDEIWFSGSAFRFDHWTSGSTAGTLITDKLFRDPGAWYHIVCVWDSDNAAAGDRMKLYVNGTEQTSFSQDTNPSLNADSYMGNSSYPMEVGAMNTGEYLSGYMAEVVFIDGQALTPTSFGEFDSDSPTIWKPIDVSGLTFGTNGFYLDFEDSANLGNDASGGTDLTEVNLAAIDQATDTPANNFSTLASNCPRHSDLTITDQNTGLSSANSQWLGVCTTQAVFAGKWYVEAKYITGYNFKLGVVGNGGANVPWLTANSSYAGYSPIGYEYQFNNSGTGYKVNDDASPSWTEGSTTNATGIIMMAFDADAGKIWWGKDGSWFDSSGTADPAAGDDPAFDSIAISTNQPWMFSLAIEGTGTNFINFGNPPYANTSDAEDENGYGKLEYEPPSGFLAVCTKNLGSDGG